MLLRVVRTIRVTVLLMAAFSLVGPATGQTQSNFNFAGNLNPTYGPSALSFFNGATTSGAVTFNTTAGYGITALPDNAAGTRTVMSIPAFSATQGFGFSPNVAGNGGGANVNQYTFGYDVYITDRSNWFAFLQTDATNTSDGDFFARPVPSGDGIGISSNYQGTVNVNTWHRVMVTVDLAAAQPTMTKFIDGVQVGQQTLGAGVDARWSLGTAANSSLIFADEDGETSPAFVSSVYFANTALTPADIQSLGGVKVIGFTPVPEPACLLGLAGVVVAFGRARRYFAN